MEKSIVRSGYKRLDQQAWHALSDLTAQQLL